MLRSLGVDVTLCSAFGGETGRILQHLIADENLPVRAVEGTFHNGAYVHDRRDGERTEIVEHGGEPLPRHVLDELYGLMITEALDADVVILSGPAESALGVIDADVYRRLASDLRSNGCRVVADLSGDRMSAVLAGGVDILKVSHTELLDDKRATDDSVETLLKAMRQLRAEGAESVILSRAHDPALLMTGDTIHEVHTPYLEPADSRGAGDSLTAGIAASLAKGQPITEAVRLGAAAGALNVTRHGLGTGHPDAIARLAERVELRPLRPTPAATVIPAVTVTPADLASQVKTHE